MTNVDQLQSEQIIALNGQVLALQGIGALLLAEVALMHPRPEGKFRALVDELERFVDVLGRNPIFAAEVSETVSNIIGTAHGHLLRGDIDKDEANVAEED